MFYSVYSRFHILYTNCIKTFAIFPTHYYCLFQFFKIYFPFNYFYFFIYFFVKWWLSCKKCLSIPCAPRLLSVCRMKRFWIIIKSALRWQFFVVACTFFFAVFVQRGHFYFSEALSKLRDLIKCSVVFHFSITLCHPHNTFFILLTHTYTNMADWKDKSCKVLTLLMGNSNETTETSSVSMTNILISTYHILFKMNI